MIRPGGGGGGGVTQTTIDTYHKYRSARIQHRLISKHAQCILIVSQNLINIVLMIYLAIKLKQIFIYQICMRPGGGGVTPTTIYTYYKH